MTYMFGKKRKSLVQTLLARSEELCNECEKLIALTQDVQSATMKTLHQPVIEMVYADTTVKRPEYKTPDSSGMDVCAWIEEPITIEPGQRKLIPTGIKTALQSGYEIQVRPRSGLALKNGITVLNTPGTVDSKIN